MKFLLEIGVEELPARFILPAVKQVANLLTAQLEKERIDFGEVEIYSTPRRLAVIVNSIAAKQEDLVQDIKGPPLSIAYQDGQPTKAALGFARSQGVEVEDLVTRKLGDGEYLFAHKSLKGQTTAAVLKQILPQVVTGINFPKNMRWADLDLRYARPLRWVVALLEEEVIPFKVGEITAGQYSYGHRQLSTGAKLISDSSNYSETLKEAYVIVDHNLRKQMIKEQIDDLTANLAGNVLEDEALLDEITNLVEYPTAFIGSFDESFLTIPAEVLTTSMIAHQRYFPVLGQDGKLLAQFIGVRNGAENQLDLVVAGNEKVLKARLADAKFFYDEDEKTNLADYLPRLEQIVFQDGLGSVADKVMRVRQSAKKLCTLLDKPEFVAVVDRIAKLAKADLVTNMVNEFPELQGIMGSKYALLSGEGEQVALGIEEHYMPRFANDQLPTSPGGIIVSLADKLDTLVGYFGLGKIPTGSQDPFALRRQALGIVQILLAHDIKIELQELINAALETYQSLFPDRQGILDNLLEFFAGRIRVNLLDQGYNYDTVDTVLAQKLTDLPSAKSRIVALDQFRETDDFTDLYTVFERCLRITSKTELITLKPELFTEAEKALQQTIASVRADFNEAIAAQRYADSLALLASLRQSVDVFFDTVMIMDPDLDIRANRLGLLQQVMSLFTQYGDFTMIVVKT